MEVAGVAPLPLSRFEQLARELAPEMPAHEAEAWLRQKLRAEISRRVRELTPVSNELLVTVRCGECGVRFDMPERRERNCRQHGRAPVCEVCRRVAYATAAGKRRSSP